VRWADAYRHVGDGVASVWAAANAQRNQHKHGVSFEQAAEAFFDPFLRLVEAERNQEPRDALVGFDALGRLLFVVHRIIEGDCIRIFSARKATPTERQTYDS
jgi:uncharacterized DUF497 family protein